MFAINAPYLDLDKIYESGQNHRWIKLKKKKYVVIDGKQSVKVFQQKDKLVFNCSEESFFTKWFWYFDMKTDYEKINQAIKRIDFDLKVCSVRGKGIRTLHLDLFESMVVALLNKLQIKNVKGKIDLLSVECGPEHNQSMREDGRIRWYEFPNAEEILWMKDKLKKQFNMMFNYKLDVLFDFCESITEGWIDLDLIESMETHNEVRDYLAEFDYFDLEGIQYICSRSLGIDLDSYLFSNNMLKGINQLYQIDGEDFVEWFGEDLCNIQGYKSVDVAMQYIENNYLNPPTERELEKWERP